MANFSSGASGVSLSTIDVDVEATKLLDAAAGADGILDRDRTSGGTTMAVLDIDISARTDAAGDQTTLEEISDGVDPSAVPLIAVPERSDRPLPRSAVGVEHGISALLHRMAGDQTASLMSVHGHQIRNRSRFETDEQFAPE